MILGFKQYFDSNKTQPTNFREKILALVGEVAINGDNINPNGPIIQDGFKKKFHTIRLDPHDRWKVGRKIEMVYRGSGYKILDHFNQRITELHTCVSVQKIEIENNNDFIPKEGVGYIDVITVRGIDFYNYWVVKIDDRLLGPVEINQLAVNDGFDNAHYFFKWFKKDFTGKIIHFTDLRY